MAQAGSEGRNVLGAPGPEGGASDAECRRLQNLGPGQREGLGQTLVAGHTLWPQRLELRFRWRRS